MNNPPFYNQPKRLSLNDNPVHNTRRYYRQLEHRKHFLIEYLYKALQERKRERIRVTPFYNKIDRVCALMHECNERQKAMITWLHEHNYNLVFGCLH
ncbi:MAG: hypothetical protein AAFW89_13770 [Bacteroidota bacterium]